MQIKVDTMEQNIQAIFLDLGNTLRILLKDQEHMARAAGDYAPAWDG